jgi:hypothetical protein
MRLNLPKLLGVCDLYVELVNIHDCAVELPARCTVWYISMLFDLF